MIGEKERDRQRDKPAETEGQMVREQDKWGEGLWGRSTRGQSGRQRNLGRYTGTEWLPQDKGADRHIQSGQWGQLLVSPQGRVGSGMVSEHQLKLEPEAGGAISQEQTGETSQGFWVLLR